MLKGSSPVRLAQLDMRPIVRANQMIAQSQANIQGALFDGLNKFATKQKELKVKKERDEQIDKFLPGLLETAFPGQDIGIGSEEYEAFSKYFKKEYGSDLLKGINELQELIPAKEELTAKQIEEQQLRRDTDLPNVVIQDLVYDRVEPVLDNRGNPTGKVRSMSSGQLIDLTNPTNPFVIEPSPSPTAGSSGVSAFGTEDDDSTDVIGTGLELSFPEYVDPNMQKQGLYGQFKVLEERDDFVTGIFPTLVEKIEDTLAAQNIDSPIKADPDVRAFKTAFGSNLNIIANALRTNPRYYASEQQDLVEQLESTASGFKIGAFTSPLKIEDKLKSLDSRLRREQRRLSNLLQSPDIDKKAASNVKLMLNQVTEAINIIGINKYRGKRVDSMDVNAKRKFFQDIVID